MRAGKFVLVAVTFALLSTTSSKSQPLDLRGAQFISFDSISKFDKSRGTNLDEALFTSPEIQARIPWNELIVSWNVETPTNTYLKVEARALYPDHATKFYTMGLWSSDPSLHPRESVTGQQDDDGNVLTDTLVLDRPAERFQIRLTVGGGKEKVNLKFLGASLLNTNVVQTPLAPNRAAWGKTIDVPERSQMPYENGKTLCSPATVSMLLAYWSKKLNRPEFDHDVPEVARAVNDPNWPGTGNWAFNMAYAGSFPGIRAYVTRFGDLSEVEEWIASGIPVGMSVCYNRLRGKSREPSGHIVVCCGFTQTGDVVINDPGTSQNVRKIFPRANAIDAWDYSKHSVYLIYPMNTEPPKNRFGHWYSK